MPDIFLLGSTAQATVCNFRDLKMWAERGLIHVENTRTGAYKSVSTISMLHRMKAMNDMVKNSIRAANTEDPFDQALVRDIQDMIAKMEAVIRQAQVQGQPHDASARRDLVRRRPVTVAVAQKPYAAL